MNNLFGFQAGDSMIHRLTGTTKLIAFLVLTLAGMLSFDLRYLVALALLVSFTLKLAHIKWQDIALMVKLVAVFAVMNLVLIYVFAPQYGVTLFHHQTILLGSGGYALTLEQLVYEFIVLIKYFFTLPLALVFLLTTNPSEFAAGLNKIGVSYRIAIAFSLTLRYIPDIQAEYWMVANAQQARGFEMSKKASFRQRIKGAAGIVMPLVFSSLNRIDEISRAMDLRRFGKGKRRTWYFAQVLTRRDYLVLLLIVGLVLIDLILIGVDGGRYWYPF
ncbi:energy-coupling factor transporter transmembrane component T family protein [Weissella soli]|uniref:energy-coupling factor transporter transmembrane component T family protein n=1 Tax=Weissella soli TaxID=155866 RepID=UPI0035A104DF